MKALTERRAEGISLPETSGSGKPAVLRALSAACCSLLAAYGILSLSGCASTDIKREVQLPKEARETKREIPVPPEPPTPDFVPAIEEVSPLRTRIVDIVARNTPLRDVLHVIAEATGLNLMMEREVNPEVLLTLTLRNVSAEDALASIFSSVDYFYTIKNNMLIVKAVDTRIYELGHPGLVQSYSIDLGGDILGGATTTGGTGTGGSGGSGGSGSSTIKGNVSLQTESDKAAFDFWRSIDESLRSILGAGAAPPQAAAPSGAPLPGQPGVQQTPQQPGRSAVAGSFTLNRMTGTIVVTAPLRDLERVERYLDTVRKVISRQVLVEAKVIEVQLTDNFQLGVDWSFLSTWDNGSAGISTQNFSSVVPAGSPSLAAQFAHRFNIGSTTLDVSALLNALQTQGEVRTLSNPRVHIMNGQSALLSVGRNKSFISRVTSTTSTGTTPITTFSVDTSSVLSGMVIGIVPYINETGEISLTITPIISNLVELESKNIGEEGNQTQISLPTVDLREMSTTVKVRDGQTVVIGGLIQRTESLQDNKVPGAGSLPVVGSLFKSRNKQESGSELVVILRPFIIAK
ncbi:MAG: pilus (MSHA type) biogenesis protein MshL [Nitrospirales bacterium]|nr:pilus (MSHA type) biogenesis protein MshL [Nitrospirales bacterium]